MVFVALAQTQSIKGNIELNLATHVKCIEDAASNGAAAIFFPELSLTGYEPELAGSLALDFKDSRLNMLQELSDENDITIGIGAPTRHPEGVRISMIIFKPEQTRTIYSKQWLHEDELPYFVPGNQPVIIQLGDVRVALAICYEALRPEHFELVRPLNPTVYLASVAKHEPGVKEAHHYLQQLAKTNAIQVLFCNAMGPSDNFVSAGRSAVWTATGDLSFKMRSDEWKNKIMLVPVTP